MKKFFCAAVVMLLLSLQSFCSAATIETANFNGNDKIIYPVVRLNNSAAEQRINAKIRGVIDDFIKELHYAAQYEDRHVLDASTNFSVGSNQSGNTVILSIIITESSYFEGAAHPSTVVQTLNFNTGSGELMGMDYLTEVGEGVSADEFRGRIERALKNYCQREGITLFDDALPLKELPENFYWDDNLHVHFIFNQYEVAPYAAGIIDVDIDN